MKRKLFKLITISLATSVLLTPAQEAFGYSIGSQINIKEAEPLIHQIGSSRRADSKATQNQGMVPEDKATESRKSLAVSAASHTTESSQQSSVGQTAQVSNTVGGLFVIVVFISYIVVGLQYRKYRVHRAAVLLQQLETLERIWKMKPQQK
jgi:multidrug efflux pump subunit AcrB